MEHKSRRRRPFLSVSCLAGSGPNKASRAENGIAASGMGRAKELAKERDRDGASLRQLSRGTWPRKSRSLDQPN